MKLELPKRKPKASAPKGEAVSRSRIQAPAVVNDLYRDMRDRRLIIPAVALLIAILAVPIVLAPSDTPAPTPPPPALDPKAEAVAPAVLAAENVSVRDFRERLDALKRKNPFKNQFAPKPDNEPSAASAPPSPSSSGGSSPAPPLAPGGNASAPSSSVPSPSPSSAPAPAPAPSGGNELVILAPRVDVSFGPVGERKKIADVKTGDLLPSDRKPVVMFIGADEKLETAQFIVSRDVTETSGEGKCRPNKNDCQFLKLKDGDTQYFRYEPDGKRYSLRISDIREVEVDRRKLEG